MDINTALKHRHDMSYGVKPVKTSVMLLPEIKNLVASLAKEHGYSQSDIIMAAVIMFSDASRNEELKLEKAVSPVYNIEFSDFYDEEMPA